MASKKSKVRPLSPDRLRKKEQSEYTARDDEIHRYLADIDRSAHALLKAGPNRERFYLTVCRLSYLDPSFARNLFEDLKYTMTMHSRFNKFLRRTRKKRNPGRR